MKESITKEKLVNIINTEFSKAGVEPTERLKTIHNVTNEDEKKGMKLPIGKMGYLGKSESKEATGSGSSGGFVAPIQGEFKEKWSQKYKDSIDCNNPKGFSQRAHCAGKSKKVETKEATGTASTGVYDAPGFEDVKMRGNHPTGSGRSWKKTQIPGGSFVKVKEKCKKFPYCNQGDINALEITKPNKKSKKSKKSLKEMVQEASLKYDISEKFIYQMLINEFSNKK
jgi:hypothetical protein